MLPIRRNSLTLHFISKIRNSEKCYLDIRFKNQVQDSRQMGCKSKCFDGICLPITDSQSPEIEDDIQCVYNQTGTAKSTQYRYRINIS